MARKKNLFVGIGAIVLIALVMGGVFLKGRLDEARVQQDQEYFSQPANISGRWVSEDRRLSFLIFASDVVLEPSYRIRVDLENIAFSGPRIIEGSVPTNRAYIRYLEVLADTEDRLVQMGIQPLRKLSDNNNCFEARVIYYKDSTLEDCEDLGTFVFRKDTSFVGEATAEISQATTEKIIAALSEACNSYYYDAELSVMNVEFDTPGTTGICGQGVTYDGYIHGTGMIAPIDGNVFQTGTSLIEFYMDPATEPMSVYRLENITLGQAIVSDYEVQ